MIRLGIDSEHASHYKAQKYLIWQEFITEKSVIWVQKHLWL